VNPQSRRKRNGLKKKKKKKKQERRKLKEGKEVSASFFPKKAAGLLEKEKS
jgi:hypothetical protein